MSKIYERLQLFTDLKLGSINSERRYYSVLREFIAVVGEDRALQLDLSDIWRYLSEQKKRPGQVSRLDGNVDITWHTIQNKFLILKSIYDFLHGLGDVAVNHFANPQFTFKKKASDPKRPHELVPKEGVLKMISLASGASIVGLRDRAIISVLFGAGLRSAECRSLQIKDVVKDKGKLEYLQIRKAKSGYRVAVLPEWAAEHLESYLSKRQTEINSKDDFLFTTYKGKPPIAKGGIYPAKSFYRTFRAYAQEAGLGDYITPHCARATFTTTLLDQGEDIHEVKDALGHSSIQTTEKYRIKYLQIDQSVAKKVSYQK